MSPLSVWTGRDSSSSGEMFLQAESDTGLGRAPVVPWSPIMKNWEDAGKAG